jgi:ACS family tartrate transporter-like MFS transporter
MSAALSDSLAARTTETLERTTLAKVTRRLLPFLFLLYIVCFLDRVNVGFAALEMNHDLGFSPAVYGFGAGIFFLGYVLFEVPSNLVLARVGARRWIARIMITWGLLASAMMLVHGPLSFYGLRFLLGVAEAGFFPGIIYYLSGWFPAAERARAIARFMIAIPLSSVVGGPVSGALLGLNGYLGLAGWQWLFLLEGLPAVALGLVVLGYLTDRPEEAVWLTAAERAWLSTHMSQEGEQRARHYGLNVRQALSNGTVWQLGLLTFLCTGFGQQVLGVWLPQIVRGFSGLSDFMVSLVSAVPYLVGAAAMVLVSAHSDRSGERILHITAAALTAAFGFLTSAYLHSPVLTVLALSLATAGLLSSHGPFWALPSTFLSGRAAAGGMALICSVANLSGLVGPYTIGLLKGASGSFHSGLLLLALVPLAGAGLALRLRRAPVLASVTQLGPTPVVST